MFSFTEVFKETKDETTKETIKTSLSRSVAIITERGQDKILEVVYFNEAIRGSEPPKDVIDHYNSTVQKYCTPSSSTAEGFILKPQYELKLAPSNATEKFPRMVSYFLAKSNSGKSYQISRILKLYNKMFPKNKIYYHSINPLANDSNYEDIPKGAIIDVNLEHYTKDLDFTSYSNCLFIFDDLDVNVPIQFDEAFYSKLDEKDKLKYMKQQKAKSDLIKANIDESIKKLLNLGRKQAISVFNVGHKYNDGIKQKAFISESTNCVLYPYGTTKTTLENFLCEKLSFGRDDAKYISGLKWYQYDFLSINTAGLLFVITNDMIRIL